MKRAELSSLMEELKLSIEHDEAQVEPESWMNLKLSHWTIEHDEAQLQLLSWMRAVELDDAQVKPLSLIHLKLSHWPGWCSNGAIEQDDA